MTLNEHVLSLREPLIAALRENLRIPSVEAAPTENAPYGEAVRRSLDHAAATARSLGFDPVDVDGHVLWCEYGEGKEMVAVLGHLDVVPAGDGWTCDPFGGEYFDGKIWGRGATDDKGPSFAALFALAALRDSGLPLKRRVRLILGCNEETGSADLKYYKDQGGELPTMGFTPDGEYPVINGEKGIITSVFSRAYTQEGELILQKIEGGTAGNVVPAHACAELRCSRDLAEAIARTELPSVTFRVTDFGLTVEAEGLSAHGSTPELGENAIGRLLLALEKLPLCPEVWGPIHFLAQKIGMETGGECLGIALRDDVSGGLSLNLGVLSGNETGLELKINYRYPVTKTYADCAPALNKTFAEEAFTLTQEFHKEGIFMPPESELVQNLMDVYRRETGLTGTPKSIGGGTYAKMLPNTVAFGPIFPGEEIREHKADEYISEESLLKNAQIIAQAMYALAKREE